MRTIITITAELEKATAAMMQLREERNARIVALAPYKIGEEFKSNGLRWKVRTIVPDLHLDRNRVYLNCHKMLTSGKWSQGTTIHSFTVED